MTYQTTRPLEFTYVNYRGETSRRRVQPSHIFWGRTEYHPDTDQWMLSAFDEEKQAWRDFALRDITWDQPWAIIKEKPGPMRFDVEFGGGVVVGVLVGSIIGPLMVAIMRWWFS